MSTTMRSHEIRRPSDVADLADDLGIRLAVEEITPRRAAALLERYGRNRPLNKSKLSLFEQDMASGSWFVNGEAIIIDRSGRPLNGAHRLTACIESGHAFVSVVVYGIDRDVFSSIDTGTSRSLRDVLSVRGGLADERIIAGIVNWSMRYDAMVASGNRQLDTSGQSTRREEVAFTEAHLGLLTHTVRVIADAKPLLIAPPGACGFVHFIASRDSGRNQTIVDAFISHFCDPAGLRSGEGPALLRATLLAAQSRSVHNRPRSIVVAALVMKAMALWLRGEERHQLKWARGSKRRGAGERFPTITCDET